MLQRLFITILLFGLTSCTDAVCIDADDFGFSHVKVPASYPSHMIHGSSTNQYADWYDSGLTLNGSAVHMVVKNWDMLKNVNNSDELSAWCPWLGPADKTPSLQEVCMMLDECRFEGSNTCSDTQDARIVNAPCLLKKGIGLYVLLAPKGFNPNISEIANRDPRSIDQRVIVKHLGYNQNATDKYYDLQIDPANNTSDYKEAGGIYLSLTSQQKMDLTGGKLYFKILDKFYDDNSGQYIVQVKSGVTSSDWDPIQVIVDMVKDYFFGAQHGSDTIGINEGGVIKNLFNNVVTQPSYRLTVTSLLTLAIIYYSINFLIGNIQMTHHDLLVRIIKIIVVSQLLTATTAWDFFNKYLFSYFINGSQALIDLIRETGGTGSGPSAIIPFMLSPHTIIKLFSLPLMSWNTFGWSLVYIMIYLVALIMIIAGLFYSAVIYIICLVMMGLIIALAPIFLCFMLFDQTRSLFDNWLKQLAAYALQPLIVVVAVTLMGLMIKHQIYQTLGFRVCKHSWFYLRTENSLSTNIRGDADRAPGLYYWSPVYATHSEDNAQTDPYAKTGSGEKLTTIAIPEAHYQDNMGRYVSVKDSNVEFCEPYECQGLRYPSFPFLDPGNPADLELLRGFWNGDFAPFKPLIYLLICGFLIIRFCMQATSIAQFITGGQVDIKKTARDTTGELGKATYKAIKMVAKAPYKVAKGTYKATKFIATKGKSLQSYMKSPEKTNSASAVKKETSTGSANLSGTKGSTVDLGKMKK